MNKRKAKKEPPRTFWIIMKAYTWSSLSVGGIKLQHSQDGPSRFAPIFDNYADALAWDPTGEHIDRLTVREAR